MEHRIVHALVSVDGEYVGTAPPFEDAIPWWGEVEDITAHLDALLGVPTAVLRVAPTAGQAQPGGHVRYHVEAYGTPRAGVLDPTPPSDWAEIVRPQPHRANWAEVGGPRRMVEWAGGIVPLTGKPVQVKTWNLSCLFRLPVSGGLAWAKATSAFASVDGDVIRHVRACDPSLAPEPLAVDLERRWSLLAHAPGEDCWEPDDATVELVLRRWVSVQGVLAHQVSSIDAPATPSQGFAEALDGLVERVADSLTPADLAGVAALTARLPSLLDQLESSGLPRTVVHGDFHPGNWRSDGLNRKIVDWADAYLGHPAADIDRLVGRLPPEQGALASKIWADAWRATLPSCDPTAAIAPMAVLSKLVRGELYQRFLDNIEPDERIYHEGDPLAMIREAVAAI